MIRNSRGIITVDYLFSLVLVSGFSFIIFALSLTLTMAEVVQYVTFSSARAFYAGDLNEQKQRDAANQKFVQLTTDPAIEPLLNSGWFELGTQITGSNIPENYPPLSDLATSQGYRQDRSTFHGSLVYFISNVLDFNIPFYGSTVNDELRGGKDHFGTYIASFLGREVTQEECQLYLEERWEKIKALDTQGAAAYSNAGGNDYYLAMADNGC